VFRKEEYFCAAPLTRRAKQEARFSFAVVSPQSSLRCASITESVERVGERETRDFVMNADLGASARGTFPVTLLLACVAALELERLALEEI
jgi:hypothetical protein